MSDNGNTTVSRPAICSDLEFDAAVESFSAASTLACSSPDAPAATWFSNHDNISGMLSGADDMQQQGGEAMAVLHAELRVPSTHTAGGVYETALLSPTLLVLCAALALFRAALRARCLSLY